MFLHLKYVFRTGSLRVSNVPEIMSNRSLILGGQVIIHQRTLINFLGRTLVRGTLGGLFGQKWTDGQFL